MVFARSSQNMNVNRWYYNGNLLEVAKEIKYLGVKINTTLNFKKHLKEKADNSQSLLNSVWKNVFANRRIVPSAKYKIYNAVVKSSLCYASQIWGGDEYEEIEQFQRNFLKKLFSLPQNTPNYSLYLETGIPKILTSTLKTQADYIIKTLTHEDSRITKKMLLYELRNKDWWMAKWEAISTTCGETLRIDLNNLNKLKEQLYHIIQKNEDNTRELFIKKATESSSRLLYSQLSYNLGNRNYFNDSLNYKEISYIFKARCEVLDLNGSPYNGSFDQFCSICNLKSKEDCFHFLSICPIFKPYRLFFLGKSTLTIQETIKVLNDCDWKTLSKFIKVILKFRKQIITEYV